MRYVVMVALMILSCGEVARVQGGPLKVDPRESLRGIPGVGVVVEGISSEVTADGITAEAIRTAIDLILRSSGIQVLTQSEQGQLVSAPYLYVNVQENFM